MREPTNLDVLYGTPSMTGVAVLTSAGSRLCTQ